MKEVLKYEKSRAQSKSPEPSELQVDAVLQVSVSHLKSGKTGSKLAALRWLHLLYKISPKTVS